MSGILGRSHRERFAKSLQRISWPSNEIQMRKSCIGENSRAADVPGIRRCNILGIYASLTPVWRGSPIGQEIKASLAFTHIYPTCFTWAFAARWTAAWWTAACFLAMRKACNSSVSCHDDDTVFKGVKTDLKAPSKPWHEPCNWVRLQTRIGRKYTSSIIKL